MTITIKGDCPSKKNQKQIFHNKFTGKPFITTSEVYKRWYPQAFSQLQGVQPVQEVGPVELTFYPATKRKSDLTNRADSIMDLLVDAKIIEDDNWSIVSQLILTFGGVDKENPRVDVTFH